MDYSQLWQAFVGIETRRIKGYYGKMLALETSELDKEDWKIQIEKVDYISYQLLKSTDMI